MQNPGDLGAFLRTMAIMYVIWYAAMSMDGRIADAIDSLDFLNTMAGDSGEDEHAIRQRSSQQLERRDHGRRKHPASLVAARRSRLAAWSTCRPGLSHTTSALVDARDRRDHRMRVFTTTSSARLSARSTTIEAAGHHRVWLSRRASETWPVRRCMLDRRGRSSRVTIAPTALGSGPALFDADALPVCRFHLSESLAVHDTAP